MQTYNNKIITVGLISSIIHSNFIVLNKNKNYNK